MHTQADSEQQHRLSVLGRLCWNGSRGSRNPAKGEEGKKVPAAPAARSPPSPAAFSTMAVGELGHGVQLPYDKGVIAPPCPSRCRLQVKRLRHEWLLPLLPAPPGWESSVCKAQLYSAWKEKAPAVEAKQEVEGTSPLQLGKGKAGEEESW